MMTQPIQKFQSLTSETSPAGGNNNLWKRLVARIKAHMALRRAEAQLYRMSDRELADLGLCRSDIPFAIREVSGLAPVIDGVAGVAEVANQNLRHAA